MNIETLINIQVKIPFVSKDNTTGLTSFSDVHLLKDGVGVVLPMVFAEIGDGLYTANFTPNSTGSYVFFVEGKVHAYINVVNKLTLTFLQNLEDVAMGSWFWDKNTSILTFIRQDGTTMATYVVTDDLSTASRERQ